jgi:pilus assembly protein CpaB
MIALGAAVLLGLLAVYFANIFLTNTERRAEVAEAGMSKVAVAAVPLDYGVPITPEKVRFVDFPSSSIPPGSFSNLAQLLPGGAGRVALRPMQVNEPILVSKLSGEGQGASLAALLPDGMRAAAVRVNDVSGVAGFIQPNDAVDVLITRQLPGAGAREAQVTDVLLQNIKVIAIDQTTKNADGTPVLAKTATLEVTPVDAQKLALAQQVGQLSFVLRKPGMEQDTGALSTVSMADLRYGRYGTARVSAVAPSYVRPAPRQTSTARAQAAPPRRAPAPAPAPQPRNNVEVVRGTQGSSYEVGNYGS